MAVEKIRIVKPYILLCEGIDTLNFFIQFLNSKALADDKRFSNDIQAFDFGGINDLEKYILNLKNMESFDNVNRILIVRDAETDVNNAVSMIKKALRNAGFPIPENCNEWKNDGDEIKTAFTLMPSCSSEPVTGALEDLCWEILTDTISDKMREDIDKFVSKMDNDYNSIGSHKHKSRLHTCLSVNKNYISLKIGQAAKAGAFDFNNTLLDPLKDVFRKGFD